MNKLIVFLSLSFFSFGFAQQHLTFFDFDTLDANNLWLRSTNVGNLERAFWEVLSKERWEQYIVYDHGPWLVGKIVEETVLSLSQWYSTYSPGPIIDGQAAMLIHPEDSLRYRVYKISRGDDSTNIDYAEWPVDFGAPVDDNGKPLILGDQTLWTAFNALDTTTTNNWWWEALNPIPIEFHQTVFGRQGNSNDEQDIFSNTVFIEWEIINKGSFSIDSAFFGFWTDIDFHDFFDNRPGIDTMRQLGYCWTENTLTPNDSIPPAVGYVLLYGPVVPSLGSTAIFKGRYLSGYKNLKLNTFHGIGDDSDPRPLYTPARSLSDAWNIARGFDSQGQIIINPITNLATKFPLSGDPVSGGGWIYEWSTGGGAGFMFFSGPFTLAPNDTQWAMIAVVPGLGSSNLNSITQMRRKVEILRSLPYDSLAFGTISYPITDVEDEGQNIIPKEFSLSQNYPNPFNPSTIIKYALGSRQYATLKVYDVLGNEVATLVNEEKPAGEYEVEFSAVGGSASGGNAYSLPSGVYFYQLRAGIFIETKKMLLLK